MKNFLHILVLLLAVACAQSALADPVFMRITPAGRGAFFMTGENVVGVQALDVEIEYNSGLLANPYVMVHGGDLTQVDSGTPGKLFLSVFRMVADPLLQIILNFDTTSDAGGGIHHVSAITRNTTAWPPASDDPPSPAENEQADGSSDAAAAPEERESVPHADPTAARGRNNETGVPAVAGAASSGSHGKARMEAMAAIRHEEKSILERFKKFKGEKSLESCVALFGSTDDRYRQEPAVALSDGKTPVTIWMEVQPDALPVTSLALSDARLLSKEQYEQGIIVMVLPNKGTWDARLVIAAGREIVDYPLVIAPPVRIAGTINGKNFPDALDKFISNPAANEGDSKTYLYEYIFTANLLARGATGPEKTASPWQR